MGHPARACGHCGYDLSGLPGGPCPECGRAPDDPALARRAARRRWAVSAGVMAVVFYAPYAWLLLIDYPWSDYRWLWVRSWPALPLAIPTTLARRLVPFEFEHPVTLVVLSLLGLLLLWGLAWVGRRGRVTLILVAAAVLALSSLNSFCLYHLFRA